jgi:hypothetical protein
LKPSLIVEFGAFKGGATLFFSEILKRINPNSKVLTVDNMKSKNYNEHVRDNPHVEIFTSSSADPKVADKIRGLRKQFPGTVFAILDSDHRKDHVLAEMKLLAMFWSTAITWWWKTATSMVTRWTRISGKDRWKRFWNMKRNFPTIIHTIPNARTSSGLRLRRMDF